MGLHPSLLTVLSDGTNLIIFLIGSLVIITTVCLNLFIIFAVISDKSMHNYTNIQFASMSCADTLVSSIAMPLMLTSSLYESWPFSDNMCILFVIGDFVGGNISMILLVIVAYHRLRCIKKPFGSVKKTRFESLLPSLFVWPTIFLFWTIPSTVIIKDPTLRKYYMNPQDCYYMYKFSYVITVDLVAYVCPIFLLIFFQISIYINLKNKKKFMNPLNFNLVNNDLDSDYKTTSSISTYSLPSNSLDTEKSVKAAKQFRRSNTINTFEKRDKNKKFLNNKIIEGVVSTTIKKENLKSIRSFRKKSDNSITLQKTLKSQQHLLFSNNYKKNKKAFRTLFFVTCSLFVFWFPWIVSWPIQTYFDCLPRNFYAFTYWMEYLNSLINSAILIIGNQHFRNKFISLIVKNS